MTSAAAGMIAAKLTTAAGAAVASSGTIAATAMGLWSYNRNNYKMDQGLHYSRFVAGATLAVAQTKQYREDIEDLTAITCKRMDLFHNTAAMSLTILTALYCPGRLGLHTPPPPGWLMGLAFLNIAGCYLWLVMVLWLSMHASLRADSAATHMLSRFCRMPVPSQFMLDRARKFLSNFEEQPLREVFRVPFFRHQTNSRRNDGPFNEEMTIEPEALGRTRHGYDMPAWYRKEKNVDGRHMMETFMPYNAKGTAPEHFEIYREVQTEWWPYDVYCRICVFLAFLHLIHAWCYLGMAHHLQETRSLFGTVVVCVPMVVLQQIILTLDIVPSMPEFPLHRLGPLAQIFALIAGALDYKRWYDNYGLALCVVCVYIAYLLHIVYTFQLLRLCEPSWDKAPEPSEVPGTAWWPSPWKLPSAFQHAVWLVAPPRHLEPGQNDLVGEMKAETYASGLGNLGGMDLPPEESKRRDVHKALGQQGESPAWRHVQVGLIAMIIGWVWLTFGWTIEVITQGTTTPSLLSAPGLPNNARDPRWRLPKDSKRHPVEVGTGSWEKGPIAGERHRRLDADDLLDVRADIADKLNDLIPYLNEIANGAAITVPSTAAALPEPAPSSKAAVTWPPLFEPRLLACAPAAHSEPTALALSKYGRGALIARTGAADLNADAVPASLRSFALEGASGYGPLLAAAWDHLGLLLASTSGAILECPGQGPTGGRWSCRKLGESALPLGAGREPFAGTVALARHASDPSALRAAVVFPGDSTVTLLSRGHDSAPWLPAGEARVPAPVAAAAFHEETLLLSSEEGSVMRMRMSDGRVSAAAQTAATGHRWQATCGLANDGGFARLALTPKGAASWEPMLLFGA